MAGFRKAKAEQAALKLGIYGATGRGKTFTALLLAEGLAKLDGKRVAMIDTERGTDFYCQPVKSRTVHPEAFDFDAVYTRSITEILDAVKSLKASEYSVFVIDSITHVWESCRLAYSGRQTKAGTIPFHAWAAIKKPYKELMSLLLSSPLHVIICGREGNDYEQDDETEELKCVGKKMKAEGETPYEPHILIRIDNERDKQGNTTIWAFAEKDRTGILAGKYIQLYPSQISTFDHLARPLLPLLGKTQAVIATEDQTASRDAEALAAQEHDKIRESETLLSDFSAKFQLCKSVDALKQIGKEITPEVKDRMITADVAELKANYHAAEKRISGAA